jgi:hypothetical protein
MTPQSVPYNTWDYCWLLILAGLIALNLVAGGWLIYLTWFE